MNEETQTHRTDPSFRGAMVAQFEARLANELESLVRRHGGVSWSAPAVSEVPLDAEPLLSAVLDHLVSRRFEIVVLLTGVGTRRLLAEADRVGRLAEVRAALAETTTVCRGPKPVFALRQNGLKATHLVSAPHTTPLLLEALATLPLERRDVLVISAGEQMPEPTMFLRDRGARPVELQLYRWDLADGDAARLAETARELIAGRIGAAAFTSQVQVRHLFDVATRIGEEQQLAIALGERVVVGAVGPTCAAALRERGVDPRVVPEHPKMGHLVLALAREVERWP